MYSNLIFWSYIVQNHEKRQRFMALPDDFKKRSLKKNLLRWICYGGLTSSVYETIKERIKGENAHRLVTILPVFITYTILYLAWHSIWNPLRPEIIFLIISGFILLIFQAHLGINRRGEYRYIVILSYISIAYEFLFSILLGTVFQKNTNMPAVAFIGMLTLMPQCIIDRFYRMFIFVALQEVLFLAVSFHVNAPHIFMLNAVNSFFFSLAGLFFYHILSSNTIRRIANEMFIEEERDTDGATRLLNKKAGELLINSHLANGTGGTMFILDIDNFKYINDTYGHNFGDHVLQRLASILRGAFRRSDILERFGGDEFVVFMDTTDISIVLRKAELIRQNFLDSMEKEQYQPTLSIGIHISTKGSLHYHSMLDLADQELYKAKRSGKNQFSVSKV